MFKQKVISLFSDSPSVKDRDCLITNNKKDKRKNPISNRRQIYAYRRQYYKKCLKITFYKTENENLQRQTDGIIYYDWQSFLLKECQIIFLQRNFVISRQRIQISALFVRRTVDPPIQNALKIFHKKPNSPHRKTVNMVPITKFFKPINQLFFIHNTSLLFFDQPTAMRKHGHNIVIFARFRLR